MREVSLAVHRGELVGIHGRSGSGKSTLLRLLAGVERPDAGTVEFAGLPAWPAGSGSWRGGSGAGPGWPRPGWVMPVFQDVRASLDPRWSVARILAEATISPDDAPVAPELAGRGWRGRALAGRGWRAPAWLAVVRQQLAGIGLADLDPLGRPPRPPRLSSGQCQRIAVLRGLLADPALLVADEPASGLDTVNAARVAGLLRQAADRGAAVVVVSHDLARLESIADRVHTMREGVLG